MGTQSDMSQTIKNFSQTITKRTIVQTVVNHVPVKTPTDTPFEATVTTPKSEDLKQVDIDTSLKYKNIHSTDEIKIDDRFVHKNTEYKIIMLFDREDYGFFKALGEEVQ